MDIVLLGYGRMGEQVEMAALERKHKIVAYVDSKKDWEKYREKILSGDVAIDFSTPDSAIDNIYNCFGINLPVIVGTTGWYHRLEEVKQICLQENRSFLYASNFSLGVNLFFALNKALAKIMNGYDDFDVSIEEIHHTAKRDAPSGTAITLADDIIKYLSQKETWVNEVNDNLSELSIKSERLSNIIGTHIVTYSSALDEIEIKHTSLSRKGFAIGAVRAAEWLLDKKGFYNINDMLNL